MAGTDSCALQAVNGTETRQVVQANDATRIAWLVLNIWPSHLGLPLLIATICLSKNIRRHATFINLCVTWIIVGISSSLLLYAGSETGPEPPRFLCLAQASLLYGQPGLTSMSAFALVFQVFYVMRAAVQERDPESHRTLRKWGLLIVPYVAFVLFATWTATVGFNKPSAVSRERRFFYCSVKDSTLTNTITAFSLGVLFITICLEIWISYIILSHWRVIRTSGIGAGTGTDINLICRTAAFALYIFLGACLSALSIKAPRSAVPDMALATMGSAVVLIFGTQRDVLQAWMFWKRNKREARSPTASPVERTRSPSPSDHSLKGVQLSSPLSDRSEVSVRVEQVPSNPERNIPRKLREPITTHDISHPILRDDLTFTVFGEGERIGMAI